MSTTDNTAELTVPVSPTAPVTGIDGAFEYHIPAWFDDEETTDEHRNKWFKAIRCQVQALRQVQANPSAFPGHRLSIKKAKRVIRRAKSRDSDENGVSVKKHR